VYTQAHKVVKGISKSTNEMCTLTRNTDVSVAKESKSTLREMWEIDVASIMTKKKEFIEKDKHCSNL